MRLYYPNVHGTDGTIVETDAPPDVVPRDVAEAANPVKAERLLHLGHTQRHPRAVATEHMERAEQEYRGRGRGLIANARDLVAGPYQGKDGPKTSSSQ